MKVKNLEFVLIISLILNVSFIASASYVYIVKHNQPGERVFLCDMIKGQSYPFEKIGLNPEQLKAFREKAGPFHQAIFIKRQEMSRERSELFGLLREDKPDKQAIDASIKQIGQTQQDIQKTIINHMIEVKGLLTKDQQAKFFDMIGNTMDSMMADKPGMPCR